MSAPEYEAVVEDDNYDLFIKRCNRMLKEGFRTTGGISVSVYSSDELRGDGSMDRETIVHTIYAQAFVKGEK